MGQTYFKQSKFGVFLMPKILYNVSQIWFSRGKREETGCHLQLSESSLYGCFSWLIGFEILKSYILVVSKKSHKVYSLMEPELSKMDVLLNTKNPEVLQRGCSSEKSYFGAYCTPT